MGILTGVEETVRTLLQEGQTAQVSRGENFRQRTNRATS